MAFSNSARDASLVKRKALAKVRPFLKSGEATITVLEDRSFSVSKGKKVLFESDPDERILIRLEDWVTRGERIRAEQASGASVKELRGGWFEVTVEGETTKVQGRAKVEEFLAQTA